MMMDGSSLKSNCSCSCSSSNSPCGGSSSCSMIATPPLFRRPKSPPSLTGLDLYGKRRQLVKIQILEREIGLLQEELKSVDELQPASRCCKELDEFVAAKVDPFVALNEKTHTSNLCWKKLCYPWRWSCWCLIGCLKKPKWCSSCCNSNSNYLCNFNKMSCKINCCCKSTCPSVSCNSVCCFSSSICKCKKFNFCCN